MERRVALKNLLFFAGAAWVLPSALASHTDDQYCFDSFTVTGADVNILAEVMETMIPETTTPGSKKLGLHLFALTMLNDCYSVKQQDIFKKGLSELDAYSLKDSGSSFMSMNSDQRQQILNKILKDGKSASLNAFVTISRELAIRGYNTSEYVLTEILPYELVPGRYSGCVKIPQKNTKKGNE